MPSRTLKRALAVAAALASFVAASPALAAPVSLRSFARENLQVATIAYRINTQTLAECPDPQMVTGLLLHDLSQYDRSARPAVARAFSLGTGIGITQIVPGSAAERAGLRTDDEILSVNGLSVEEPAAIDRPRRSYRRLDRFSKDLQRALGKGPADLTIRRNGAVMRTNLSGQSGCGGELALINSRQRTAWSDGSQVVITTAMMRLARSDDELAFVVAHEMAHNILGHSKTARRGIFGLRVGGKQEELAADYMAVWMMTGAGYKAESGISFLRAAQRRLLWNLSFDHPGFGRRIKTVSRAITSAATSPTWARAHAGLGTPPAGSDRPRKAFACGTDGPTRCATVATEARRLPAAAMSSRADRVATMGRVFDVTAAPTDRRTDDRRGADAGKPDMTVEAAAETHGRQPTDEAPPTIVRNVQGIAPDVAVLRSVERTLAPRALDGIALDASVAVPGHHAVNAPTTCCADNCVVATQQQPAFACASSPIQRIGAAERIAWPTKALMPMPTPTRTLANDTTIPFPGYAPQSRWSVVRRQ